MSNIRTTVLLMKEDKAAIKTINEYVGATGQSTAIRYAVRKVARSIHRDKLQKEKGNDAGAGCNE